MSAGLIYQWINFVIFAGILIYFLREPFRDFLGDRRERLRKELDEVSHARLESETGFKECRKKMAQADQSIQRLKEELRQEGELEKSLLIRRAKEYAHKIREDAGRMTHQELSRAKETLKKKTFVLALELARKKIEGSITAQDQERLMAWGMESLARGVSTRGMK